MPDSPESLIRFACPHCAAGLRVGVQLSGRRQTCPQCKSPVVVPSAKNPAEQAVGLPTSVGFNCLHCDTRLSAPVSQVGEPLECPDCGVSTRVPPPPPPKKPGRSIDEIEAYEVWGADEDPNLPPQSADAELIRLSCELCDTPLSATADQIGQSLECPDCGHQTRVRRPPPAKPKPQLPPAVAMDLADPFELSPPIATPSADTYVDSVDDEAGRERAWIYGYGEENRRRPTLPARPFITGVVGFLFRQEVWSRWVMLWIGLEVVLLVAFIGSTISHFGVFVFVGLAILLLMWLTYASTVVLRILEDTANGSDEIVDWPDAMFVDWMFQGFTLVSALMMSSLLGTVVTMIPGLAPTPLLGWILSLMVVFFSFPVFLLALLETGSPINPISPNVWRSLLTSCGTWARFYLVASSLVICTVLLDFALAWVHPLLAALVAVGIDMAAMFIYFRLLGRVALCFSVAQMKAEDRAAAEEDRNEREEDSDGGGTQSKIGLTSD